MTPEQAAALRAEFKPEQIGKLPRVSCPACTKANKERRGSTCDKHKKIRCEVCKNYISEQHIHLDYVGHAATTDRLLQVDPEWTWEPITPDEQHCLPDTGLWIKLTVAGVTRFGFGDGDDPKVMIGDAIRNAAMRFGVALDLWAKEDLRSPETDSGPVELGTTTTLVDDSRAGNNAEAVSANSAAGESAGFRPVTPDSPAPSEREGWIVPTSQLANLKAKVKELNALGASMSMERSKADLPPLTDKLDPFQWESWKQLVADVTVRLQAEAEKAKATA